MKARVRAWEQAMKGVLSIIPADPMAIRERCEITAPPCNEDGKRLELPVNWLATGMWHDALVRKGSRFGVLAEGGGYEDYLVGVIVVISGNSRLMDELFIRLP